MVLQCLDFGPLCMIFGLFQVHNHFNEGECLYFGRKRCWNFENRLKTEKRIFYIECINWAAKLQ